MTPVSYISESLLILGLPMFEVLVINEKVTACFLRIFCQRTVLVENPIVLQKEVSNAKHTIVFPWTLSSFIFIPLL